MKWLSGRQLAVLCACWSIRGRVPSCVGVTYTCAATVTQFSFLQLVWKVHSSFDLEPIIDHLDQENRIVCRFVRVVSIRFVSIRFIRMTQTAIWKLGIWSFQRYKKNITHYFTSSAKRNMEKRRKMHFPLSNDKMYCCEVYSIDNYSHMSVKRNVKEMYKSMHDNTFHANVSASRDWLSSAGQEVIQTHSKQLVRVVTLGTRTRLSCFWSDHLIIYESDRIFTGRAGPYRVIHVSIVPI